MVDQPQSQPPAKGNQPMVRDYWIGYKKRARMITVLMQITITAAVGVTLIYAGLSPFLIEFWVILLVVGIATISLNVFLTSLLLTPLKDLTSALTHISGEPSTVKPPNPNTRNFERDGFKPLLELIYRLSSNQGSDEAKSTSTHSSQSETWLNDMFAHTKTSVVVFDADGAIVSASKNAPVEVDTKGKRQLRIYFDNTESFDEWRGQTVEKLVRAEKYWRRVSDKLVGDKERRIFDISVSYEQNNRCEIVMVLVDHTGEYQPEDDQLDFISFAAHELRGPVTVIRGYLDVLAEELDEAGLYPPHEALLSRLTVSANRLSTYINNILNASRYDRRHMKVHLYEKHLSQIYDTVKDDMSLRASTQNRLLTVSLPDDLPTVAADVSTLSEVFANLIDNGIKYSNEGGTVYVKAEADGNYVRVSVIDQGIGMPSNVVKNLFHKFYRSHRSRETVAGTGIGLYICKAIVESHGGMIEVRSAEGEGSIFSFTLPIYSTVAEKLAASDNTNQALLRSSSGGWIKNHSKFRG